MQVVVSHSAACTLPRTRALYQQVQGHHPLLLLQAYPSSLSPQLPAVTVSLILGNPTNLKTRVSCLEWWEIHNRKQSRGIRSRMVPIVEEPCGKKRLRRLGLLEYGWLHHHGESWTRNVRATPTYYGISPYCGQFQLHINNVGKLSWLGLWIVSWRLSLQELWADLRYKSYKFKGQSEDYLVWVTLKWTHWPSQLCSLHWIWCLVSPILTVLLNINRKPRCSVTNTKC